MPASTGPLAGVRVLDLSRLLPGPMCTLYLADLGADVVKIEDTGAGDYGRTLGAIEGVSVVFDYVNRNKRSVALDLKHPDGRAAFFALVRTAGILVESFRPGVMSRLGVGYDAVAAVNPRIVYASISGYGQDGPRAGDAGHDINYLALSGVLDQMGARDGPPALANLQIADLLGGAAMPAIAILGALFDAQRSGRGRCIDVAMADAVLAHSVVALQSLLQRGGTKPRGTDLLTGGLPCYGLYPTQDGRHIAVGALEEKFWIALCNTLERPDLMPFGQSEGVDGLQTRSVLARIFASRPLAHWVQRFAGVDCCVTPVLTLAESLADPHFAARGIVPTASGGDRFGPPFRVAETPARKGPAPAQGEHTRDLLKEAGYDERTLAALEASGAIRSGAPT